MAPAPAVQPSNLTRADEPEGLPKFDKKRRLRNQKDVTISRPGRNDDHGEK